MVRMGTWGTGERRRQGDVGVSHTPGLGMACGSKCDRACAAVSMRVCLRV